MYKYMDLIHVCFLLVTCILYTVVFVCNYSVDNALIKAVIHNLTANCQLKNSNWELVVGHCITLSWYVVYPHSLVDKTTANNQLSSVDVYIIIW